MHVVCAHAVCVCVGDVCMWYVYVFDFLNCSSLYSITESAAHQAHPPTGLFQPLPLLGCRGVPPHLTFT